MYKKALRDGTLSFFNKPSDHELSCKDVFCFFANYILIMLALCVCGIITSVVYIIFVYRQAYCWINALSITMTILHLNSQFCAIQSCFIFSKIVHKVTNRLNKLAKEIGKEAKNMAAADCQHNHPQNVSTTSENGTSAHTNPPALSSTPTENGTSVHTKLPALSCAVSCL